MTTKRKEINEKRSSPRPPFSSPLDGSWWSTSIPDMSSPSASALLASAIAATDEVDKPGVVLGEYSRTNNDCYWACSAFLWPNTTACCCSPVPARPCSAAFSTLWRLLIVEYWENILCCRSSPPDAANVLALRRKKMRLDHFHASMPAKKRIASMNTMPHSQLMPVCLKTTWLMTGM